MLQIITLILPVVIITIIIITKTDVVLSFAIINYINEHGHHLTATTVLTAAATTTTDNGHDKSRWVRRTAKRRQRTENLLDLIEAYDGDSDVLIDDSLHATSPLTSTDYEIPTLQIPPKYKLNWDEIDSNLDPIRGGNIKQVTMKSIERGERKRAQVEAFHYVVSRLLDSMVSQHTSRDVTIIDCGSGAGNLAIGLAGMLSRHRNDSNNQHVNVLAVDVNKQALQRLEHRAGVSEIPTGCLSTLCADLADTQEILSHIPQNHDIVVVSLHACGSASDMAMELALECKCPFVICPCCTGKSLSKRSDALQTSNKTFMSNASFLRSGCTANITYPRSKWLRSLLAKPTFESKHDKENNNGYEGIKMNTSTEEEQYTILAKVADVGLGPQTPESQREHQRRAKKIVEIDRLLCASEHDFTVTLIRMANHNPLFYGKGEVLLGAKRETLEADVLLNLPVTTPSQMI